MTFCQIILTKYHTCSLFTWGAVPLKRAYISSNVRATAKKNPAYLFVRSGLRGFWSIPELKTWPFMQHLKLAAGDCCTAWQTEIFILLCLLLLSFVLIGNWPSLVHIWEARRKIWHLYFDFIEYFICRKNFNL